MNKLQLPQKELAKEKTSLEDFIESDIDILSQNKAGIESGQIIVFFLDECHLLHGDINGYAWGRSDIRIEVPITNQKNRQTYARYLSIVRCLSIVKISQMGSIHRK